MTDDQKQQPTSDVDAFMKSDAAKQAAAPASTGASGNDVDSFMQSQQSSSTATPQPTHEEALARTNMNMSRAMSGQPMDNPEDQKQADKARKDVVWQGPLAAASLGLGTAGIGAPIAEAIGTASLRPLIPVVGNLMKSYLGAKAGHYIGKDVGGMVGDPELGGDIGGVAGGLYGGMGGKFPSKASMLEWLMSRGAASAPAAEAGAAEGAIANEPFKLTSPNTGSEAAIQQPMNFPPAVVSDEPFSLHAPAGETEPPVQSHLFGEMPKGNPTPFGKSPAVEVAGPSAPKPQKANIDTIVSEATGVKPIEKNVPLRDQVPNSPSNTEISGPGDPLKAKYPDKDVRQMVRANGEKIVDAVGDNDDLMKQIHDIDRVQLRQALINSGEDMGQTTISSSKYAGSGSISREEAFNRLLSKGIKPEQIVELAKKK